MARPEAAITTLLFTDLVNSTELIGQVGDEQAQRIFEAHHGTLVDCLGAHGGEELSGRAMPSACGEPSIPPESGQGPPGQGACRR